MDQQLLDRASRPDHAIMLELASTRFVIYRVLASTFLPPAQERVDDLATMPKETCDNSIASRFPYFPAWQEFLLELKDFAAKSLPETQRLYGEAFSSSDGAHLDMLHESRYRSGGEHARAEVVRDLVNRYNNVGLSVGSDSPVPPDHISVQLEYLAVLCDLEATGWNDQEPSQALRSLRLTRAHLRKHLCWWLPRLERHLTLTAPKSVYLRAACAMTEFANHERDLLDMIIQIQELSQTPEGGSSDD